MCCPHLNACCSEILHSDVAVTDIYWVIYTANIIGWGVIYVYYRNSNAKYMSINMEPTIVHTRSNKWVLYPMSVDHSLKLSMTNISTFYVKLPLLRHTFYNFCCGYKESTFATLAVSPTIFIPSTPSTPSTYLYHPMGGCTCNLPTST